MSVLSFENRGGGNGNGWNYSDPNKADYWTSIQGTVVEIKEVAKTKFNSNEIDCWEDGKPKLNICLTIQGQSGRELDWIFGPGGVTKPTAAMAACRAALQAAGLPAQSIAELGGKFISVATQEPPQGFAYGAQNPRPWAVQILGEGQVPFRGVKEYQAQPAPVAQPVAQPMAQPAQVAQPQPIAQAPAVQPQPVAQPAPAPVQESPYYDQDIPF